MAYINQDVEIYAGDSKDLDLTIYDDAGNEVDLSQYSVYYYVYGNSGTTVGTKTVGDGIEIVTEGKCTISLDPSDTKNLFGEYNHEVDISQGSDVYTVMTGKFTVLQNIATEV
jgi:hypothetical protein